MLDPELFGRAMGDEIVKAVAPLRAEIADLKKQLAEKPDYAALVAAEVAKAVGSIRLPQDGKDCDMVAVKAMVAEAVAAIPVPKDGKDGAPGVDGKSITLEDVRPVLAEAVKAMQEGATKALDEAIKAIPVPVNGKDGLDGKNGSSVTVDDVRPIIDQAISSMAEEARATIDTAIKSIAAPKDGKDGRDGIDGQRGERGADGIGLAGAMLDREGSLLVTLTNGEVKSLGVVVGKDGANGIDGKDGADGISLDAFDLDYLDETHEVRIKASCGGRTKETRFPAGGLRPAGYWREGTKAKACETWVHDGSLWIAMKDTPSKPQTGSDDWIIAARKGRDGETIVKTVQAGPPAPIKLGGGK